MSINVPRRAIGFAHHFYGTMAHSTGALDGYLELQRCANSLTWQEREAVALTVSQVYDCAYMLSTHSCFAAEAGFTPPQVRQLRDGVAPFSPRLDALVRLARNLAVERGYADTALLDGFSAAGYSRENLVDLMMAIGHVTIGSYLSNACQVPLDFPAAAGR